jgi:hypothetical protein
MTTLAIWKDHLRHADSLEIVLQLTLYDRAISRIGDHTLILSTSSRLSSSCRRS